MSSAALSMAVHCCNIACPAEVMAKPSGVRFSNVTPRRFSSTSPRPLGQPGRAIVAAHAIKDIGHSVPLMLRSPLQSGRSIHLGADPVSDDRLGRVRNAG